MGVYSTITMDQIVASAKMRLRLQDTSNDLLLNLFAEEGCRELKTLSLYSKQQECLTIVDNKAKLPCGFQKLLGLRFTDSTSGDCFNYLYVDRKFLSDCGCNSIDSNVADFFQSMQIQNGYIFFNSDTTATEASIAYMGLNTDEDGNLIVYEDYERAVRAYACYMFALSYPNDYDKFTIMEFKKEWIAQKAYVKGTDVARDFQLDKREISEYFRALMVSNFVNY